MPNKQPLEKVKTFDFNLETLRGLAAIFVVCGHLQFADSRVDPVYHLQGMWSYAMPAHLSVLVFFLLSGYVIGLSHRQPLTRATIPTYLRKRFVRLYPIYFICVLLALLVAQGLFPPTIIAAHLTMTQGLFTPVIRSLAPSWSLTYEVVFYLLFIPISYFRINPIPVAVGAVLLGCVNAYLFPRFGSPLFSSFAFGFSFWLCGLIMFEYLSKVPARKCYAWMLSFLFLFLALEALDAPVTLFSRAGLIIFGKDLSAVPVYQPGSIPFRDFSYLPYCFVLVSLFASKDFAYRTWLMVLLLLLPALALYHYVHLGNSFDWATLFFPGVAYTLAVLLFAFPNVFEDFAQRVVKRLVFTGTLSYGLYIVHFPILYAIGQVTAFSGSLFTFSIRTIVFLALSFAGAYLLEEWVQPWAKRLLSPAISFTQV